MQVFMRQRSCSTCSSASSSICEPVTNGAVGEADERLEGVLEGCRGVEADGWVFSSIGGVVVVWPRCRLVGRDEGSSSSAFRLFNVGAISAVVVVGVVFVRSVEWCN